MAIYSFTRTVKGNSVLDMIAPISFESVADEIRHLLVCERLTCESEAEECSIATVSEEAVPKELNFLCYGGPYDIDPRTLEFVYGNDCDGYQFSWIAKQECLFFANDVDLDTAETMAAVAAIADDVIYASKRSVHFGSWLMREHPDIPQSVLKPFQVPFMETKKSLVAYPNAEIKEVAG